MKILVRLITVFIICLLALISFSACGSKESHEEHTPSAEVSRITVAATCSQWGTREITTSCTECHEILSSRYEQIPPRGHFFNNNPPSTDTFAYGTPGIMLFAGEDNGCGQKAGYFICNICGETQSVKVTIPHVGDQWRVTKTPSCTEDGERTNSCSRCGEVLEVQTLTKFTHSYESSIEKTDIQDVYVLNAECGMCGDKKESESITLISRTVLGGDGCFGVRRVKCVYTDGSGSTKELICYDGTMSGVHVLNGQYVTEEALDYGTSGLKLFAGESAVCGKDTVGYYVCDICQNVIDINIRVNHVSNEFTTSLIPGKNSNEYTKRETCKACNGYSDEPIIITSSSVIKPASCGENGIKKYTYVNLYGEVGELETDSIPATNEHTLNGVAVTTDALPYGTAGIFPLVGESVLCRKNFLGYYHCDVCGKIRTINVTVNHLSEGEWTVTKPASCTEEGEKSLVCQICDEIIGDERIPVPTVEHDYISSIEENGADSVKVDKCSVCEKTVEERITVTQKNTVKQPTCCENGTTVYYYTDSHGEECTLEVADIPPTYIHSLNGVPYTGQILDYGTPGLYEFSNSDIYYDSLETCHDVCPYYYFCSYCKCVEKADMKGPHSFIGDYCTLCGEKDE